MRLGRLAMLGLFVCALSVALWLGGCDKSGPTTLEDVRKTLASKMIKGWQVDYVRDVKFAVAPAPRERKYPILPIPRDSGYVIDPGDLIIWKTEKVALQGTPACTQPSPNPGNVYFILSPKKQFIDPEKFKEIWKKNEDIRGEHEHVLHKVQAVPRDPVTGEFKPRGDDSEPRLVAGFKEQYAALPPFERDLPTHYVDKLALKLRDYRTEHLFPESREHQQEMNQVYTAIIQQLREYYKK